MEMRASGRQRDAAPPARRGAHDHGRSAEPQIWERRWAAVVHHLEPFETEACVERLIDDLIAAPGPVTLAFVNAHVMNLIVSRPDLSEWLRDSDLVLRDGVGVSVLLRILGVKPGLNLNGTDLIPRLIARVADRPIALFGTAEPFLARAADAIVKRHGAVREDITTSNGFQHDSHYVDLCLSRRPRLVVLGMGVPKQERVASLLKREVSHDCLIVCGGAILDFYASRFRRAPEAVRRLNLEWLFRFALEPSRLFGRYVVGNPAFLLRAARVRMVSGTLSRRDRYRWNDNVPSVPLEELLQQEAAGGLPLEKALTPEPVEAPAAEASTVPVPVPEREREISL